MLATVLAAIAKVQPAAGPSGKPATVFGQKVFISAIWAQLPASAFGDLAELKSWLIGAQRRGELVLCRIDLVAAVDGEAVAKSQTCERGAEYHCVRDDSMTMTARSGF